MTETKVDLLVGYLSHDWVLPLQNDSAANYIAEGSRLSDLHAALNYVKKFDCALDGGAHVGTWTAELCKKFAAVYAVEPNFRTYLCLMANARRRGFAKECFPVHVALGAEGAMETMVSSDKHSLSAFIKKNGHTNITPVTTIDSLKIEPGFIKLDIEGMEVLAIRGAKKTIERSRPVLLIENKPFNMARHNTEFGEIHTYLTGLAYKLVVTEMMGVDVLYVPEENL